MTLQQAPVTRSLNIYQHWEQKTTGLRLWQMAQQGMQAQRGFFFGRHRQHGLSMHEQFGISNQIARCGGEHSPLGHAREQ